MTEIKTIPQVKLIKSNSSATFEQEINEFCETHEIAQIQYSGISNTGTYSCMIVYVETREQDTKDDFNQGLLNSIKEQIGIVDSELAEKIKSAPSMSMDELENL